MDETYKTFSSRYMEKTKTKSLNIELSNSFNKIDKFGRLKKSFGKVFTFFIKIDKINENRKPI